MSNAPNVSPSHPDHNPSTHPIKPSNELPTKKFKTDSGKAPTESTKKLKEHSGSKGPAEGFAQKAWGFDAAEAKKFISTLANTIITQIKHEDEKAKEQSNKLKQAEEGEDQ